MISDNIIKQKFAVETLEKGVNEIFSLQTIAVRAGLQRRSGQLLANLDARGYQITANGSHYMVVSNILKYLRFNEIRIESDSKRGNIRLYNKIVWGILFGETLPTLRFGLSDEIRNKITNELKTAGKAFNQENIIQ